MTPAEFVQRCWPLAVRAGHRYGINPVVVLMQAAVESAWGSSYSATTRRNYFGITAAGAPNAYWTGSYSTSSVSGLKFRIYSSAQKGFFDFARLIREKYPNAATLSASPAQYAHAISYSSYISEVNGDHRPTYEANLNSAAARILPELSGVPPLSTVAGVLAAVAFLAGGAYWQRRALAPTVKSVKRYLKTI